jgi:hypothetical protein
MDTSPLSEVLARSARRKELIERSQKIIRRSEVLVEQSHRLIRIAHGHNAEEKATELKTIESN